LDRFVRSAFVAALGNLFSGRDSVGDGELFRALKELQREFMCPPRRITPRHLHAGKP
jgi:hypothetical protein